MISMIRNITDCHDIAEILLKVALNTITPPPFVRLNVFLCNYTMYTIVLVHAGDSKNSMSMFNAR